MCLIIHIPAGKHVSKRIVAQATKSNSDGSGVMFSMNDKLFFERKVTWQPRQLAKYLRSLVDYDRTVHFRMATQGKTNEENTHPFICGANEKRQWALVHNGIMNSITISDKEYSDTWHFAEEMKSILNDDPDILDKDVFRAMISDYIGSFNKVVFMDNFGKSYIINKSQGTERDGCWYSNTYSIDTNTTKTGVNHNGYYNYHGYRDEYESYDDYHKHKYLGSDTRTQTTTVSDRLGLNDDERPFITKYATWHRENGTWVKDTVASIVSDQSEIDTEMEDASPKFGQMTDEQIAMET